MSLAIVRTEEGLAPRRSAARWRADVNGPGALWASYYADAANHARAMAACGVTLPCADHMERTAALVLLKMGVTSGPIVFETNIAAEGFADAPLWRPACEAEDAVPAVLLPVIAGAQARTALPVADFDNDPHAIVDLIAIPCDGTRARSLTGITAAVGAFAAGDEGVLTLAAGGLGWLERHGGRARALAEELNAADAARLLPPAGTVETLIIEPAAFAWRPDDLASPVPRHTRAIACRDSRGLAARIDAAMKVKPAKPPLVLAPATERDIA